MVYICNLNWWDFSVRDFHDNKFASNFRCNSYASYLAWYFTLLVMNERTCEYIQTYKSNMIPRVRDTMMTVISSYAVADDSSPAVRRCRKSSVRAGRATTPGAADKNDRLDKHPSNKGNHVTFMIQPTMEQRIVSCWLSTSFPSITY